MHRFLSRFLSRYKAAVFDLDSTLTDSIHVWDHLCRDWLSGKGISAADTLEQEIALMTLTQAAEYVIRRYSIRLRYVTDRLQ